ncbi:lactoferrin/transferrin family TonB-dependent receptor [Neisseria lisongii]|uniref:Lactoferrin/transferrin family TonB-dependent receptor n=1 Tax=Neisseria lisongii TaxID=2912188 RepID=A0AAW5AE93_9NEIS|nr:lactoferrin/transferrin family TonB-dependent receptor [Neisseria lisongii]MCF7528776.1 lactoferrin/transferrin family TonB-dependent receptor [Neisseria lisongii]MCF7529634.1 lactoferrin/transferrin family TonB-dependent receptor [Neisseria lisongii]
MTYPTHFKMKLLALLLLAPAGAVCAEEVATHELQTVNVVAKPKKLTKKTKEVTGLGKIVKDSEQLNRQQVLGVRDLVRYDPGVSTVEQGRGGTSGFSIRGVDKNRVLIAVDGIAQIQSYADTTSDSGGSGSINEVEIENISAVEISKGSNGAEVGSGGLGGSVNYTTKDVGDIISGDKPWGLNSKSVYSSRDKRAAQTLSAAFRQNGWEGLVQYTRRQGHEPSIHRDAGNFMQTVSKQSFYENKYDLSQPNTEAANLFRFEDCIGAGCIRHEVAPTVDAGNAQLTPSTRDLSNYPFSPQEEAQRRAMVHPKETLSANQYTGSNRIRPNPMEYQTDSWLTRLGYRFSPNHYLGWLNENTTQHYDSRDMYHEAYYLPPEETLKGGDQPPKTDEYVKPYPHAGNNKGVWYNTPAEGFAGLQWAKARFLEEKHRKNRNGIVYRYENKEKDSWADQFELTFNRQDIRLDTSTVKAQCSPYPNYATLADCEASADKPGSSLHREDVRYRETHNVVQAKWQKQLRFDWSKHNLQIAAGYDDFDSSFNKTKFETNVYQNFEITDIVEKTEINGKPYGVRIYRKLDPLVLNRDHCKGVDTCRRDPISGSNRYFALRNNMSFGKYLDWGVGLRYDRYAFKTADVAIPSKTYNNVSWNTGIVVKSNRHWSLSYRIGNGFRVPSFQDLYGFSVPGQERGSEYKYIADLKPEKSLNQEIGLNLKGDFGYLEAAVFDSRYRDLIAYANSNNKPETAKLCGFDPQDTTFNGCTGNFNLQNADLKGINLNAHLDLNGMWQKMPEGLSLNVAYNRIKAKKLFINHKERFSYVSDYPLETIQPSRYVVGLNYDSPSDKWGATVNWIYSKAKDPSELVNKISTQRTSGRYESSRSLTQARPRPWYTFDVVGYYRPWKQATLRFGVYNLMNYRYLTWETLRQTSVNTAAQAPAGSNYKRYAAPGRNFILGFEMKF